MSAMAHFRCASCGGTNRIPDNKLDKAPTCGRCHAGLDVSGHPTVVGDDTLDALVAAAPVPVLVDFYADWCGPCRSLAPVLAQLGQQHAGKLWIVKIDTEKHQRWARSLSVQGIPAVFLFKGGNVVANQSGAAPLGAWQRWVAPHLD